MKSVTEEVAQWVDCYTQKLLDHAYYLLSDRTEAEDMVQEVFLTALSCFDSFEGKSNPLTWLKGILHHKVADYYKKKYKAQHVSFDYFFDEDGSWRNNQNLEEWAEEEPDLVALLDDTYFHDTLEDCLEKLPPKWKILIKMCYLEAKKYSEIWQDIYISQTNYWKTLQRSRLQLRECLEINWFKE